jgi:hypothetical protein
VIDLLHVTRDLGPGAARHGPAFEVFFGGQAGKGAAALGNMRHTHADDVLGCLAADIVAVIADGAGSLDHAAQGTERRGLAGAIGAQKRRDTALLDREIKTVQDPEIAIGSMKTGDFE